MSRSAARLGLRLRFALPLALAFLATSCTSTSDTGGAERRGRTTTEPNERGRQQAADAAVERRVDDLLARMTIEEKVGQTIQADIATVTPDEVRRYHLGSVLAGGGSDPGGRYDAEPRAWLDLVDDYYRASVDDADGGVAIPITFGIDAVHGHNNVVGATLFPHNVGLGATRDPKLVRQIARATALEVRSTGMDWSFAPTLAVPQDLRWGRTYEGYAEDPEIVAELAPVVVEGLQGRQGTDQFLDEKHVLASIKHFVGDGGTTDGTDQGDTDLPEDQLLELHGAGYPPAIAAGAQTVMASYNSVRGQKVHGSEHLLTEVLKGDLGFDGFVIGDWNGHLQVPGCTRASCPQVLRSGVDMVMAPDTWREYHDQLLAAVRSGAVDEELVDAAVRRILRVKIRAGLLESGLPSKRPVGGRFELLGSAEHRALARRAVSESLVLLKNEGGLLPLDPASRVLVVGSSADDLARQSGGWTLTWQGTGTTRADFPNAQTIAEAITEQVDRAGGAVVSDPGASDVDVAIVVTGEPPSAEGFGDLDTLALGPDAAGDLALMRDLEERGIPVVTVLVSGRPRWVNRELNASSAFVAAWLPGSEGGGVADVLLRHLSGRVQHDATGRLGYTWPKRADQFTAADRQADPLFAIGDGLAFGDDGDLPALDE